MSRERSSLGVTTRRVGHNALSGGVLLFVRLAVTFVVSPVVVHALGDLRYGTWELALGIIGYMGLLDLGLAPAIVRHVALAAGRNDPDEAARIFWTSVILYSGLGTLAAGVCLALGLRPELLFGEMARDVPEIFPVLALLAVDLVVRFPGTAVAAFWNGLQHHLLVNTVDAGFFLLQGALTLLLVPRAAGSPLLVLATLIVGLMVTRYLLLALLLALRHGRMLRREVSFHRELLAPLLGFGAKSLLLRGATVLNRELVPVVIAHVVALSSVVFFAIPGRLFVYTRQFAYAVGGPLTAWFAHVLGRDDRETLRRHWVRSARPLQGIYLGAAVGLAFLGVPFLHRWMGPEIAARGAVVVRWFAVGLALEAFGVNTVRLLTARARHGWAALVQGATGLGALLLAWPLGGRFGLAGVVIPLVAFHGVRQGALLALAARDLGIEPVRYAARTAALFVFPCLATGLALAGLARWLPPTGYPTLALHGMAAVAAFLAACLPVRELRESLASLVRLLT